MKLTDEQLKELRVCRQAGLPIQSYMTDEKLDALISEVSELRKLSHGWISVERSGQPEPNRTQEYFVYAERSGAYGVARKPDEYWWGSLAHDHITHYQIAPPLVELPKSAQDDQKEK